MRGRHRRVICSWYCSDGGVRAARLPSQPIRPPRTRAAHDHRRSPAPRGGPRRRAAALVLTATTTLGAGSGRGGRPAAGDCTATTGVIVAVDFGHWGGPVLRSCGSTPTTGYALLNQGGWHTTGTEHDGPGFICRIGYGGYRHDVQYPTPAQQACVLTPPASAYWAFWQAGPGQDVLDLQPGRRGELPSRAAAASACGCSAGPTSAAPPARPCPTISPQQLRTRRPGRTAGGPEIVNAPPVAASVSVSRGSAWPTILALVIAVLLAAAGASRRAAAPAGAMSRPAGRAVIRTGAGGRRPAARAASGGVVDVGDRAGRGGEPDHQPAAAAADLRRARPGRGAAPHRRAVGARLPVLPDHGADRHRHPGRLPDRLRERGHARRSDPVPAAAHPDAIAGTRACRSAGRCRWRRCCRPPSTARGWPACCAASAPPTPWPTPSARCGCCPARCTSWASRSPSRCRWPRSWWRACSGCAGRGGCAARAPRPAGTAGDRRSRCCTTRWSGRCGWRPRWTRAATGGPAARPGRAGG